MQDDLFTRVILAILAALGACATWGGRAKAWESPAPARVAPIADTVTRANANARYRALLDAERDALINALGSRARGKLSRDTIREAAQDASLADTSWLRASGYDFAVRENQAAGIKVLSAFSALPRWLLRRSETTAREINQRASARQKAHAAFDADAIAYMYFIPEALGPKLGHAFLGAYRAGEIGKAAALIKATEISPSAAKAYFKYPRPFLVEGSGIRLVPDRYVAKDGVPYTAFDGSFPSGHANTGFTQGLLLAEMLPERFTALIDRGAAYGYSRVVLGVHYPIDVVGSRMVAQRNVAHFLNDPAYKKLFDAARDQLRAALERRCGVPLSACAKPTSARSDPWAAAAMRAFYDFTMAYDLPRTRRGRVDMRVPKGAEVLLATRFPRLSADERRAILKRTADESGHPLDSRDPRSGFWQRINLHEAARNAEVVERGRKLGTCARRQRI